MFDYWITSTLTKNDASDGFRRLRKLVSGTCMRRTKETLDTGLQLPGRVDREEQLNLGRKDRALYDFFRARAASFLSGLLSAGRPDTAPAPQRGNILTLINFLRVICNHGEMLLPPSAVQIYRDRYSPQPETSSSQKVALGSICDDGYRNRNDGRTDTLEFPPYASSQHKTGCCIDERHGIPTTHSHQPLCQPCSGNSPDRNPVNHLPSAKVARLIDNIRREQQGNLEQNSAGTVPVKRHEASVPSHNILDTPANRIIQCCFQLLDENARLD